MKTAEEYLCDLAKMLSCEREELNNIPEQVAAFTKYIQAIQLDAYKAGMAEAARISNEQDPGYEIDKLSSMMQSKISDAILSARDNKTTL